MHVSVYVSPTVVSLPIVASPDGALLPRRLRFTDRLLHDVLPDGSFIMRIGRLRFIDRPLADGCQTLVLCRWLFTFTDRLPAA